MNYYIVSGKASSSKRQWNTACKVYVEHSQHLSAKESVTNYTGFRLSETIEQPCYFIFPSEAWVEAYCVECHIKLTVWCQVHQTWKMKQDTFCSLFFNLHDICTLAVNVLSVIPFSHLSPFRFLIRTFFKCEELKHIYKLVPVQLKISWIAPKPLWILAMNCSANVCVMPLTRCETKMNEL